MVLSKLYYSRGILSKNFTFHIRSIVTRTPRLICKSPFRTFARSSRYDNFNKLHRIDKNASRVSFSWKQIFLQGVFTFVFLYAIYQINIFDELIETKFRSHSDHHTRFKFDVYDEVWANMLSRCGFQDTLLHRRIVQLTGLLFVCFFTSFAVKAVTQSKNIFYLLGSGASSSFISPITSMFLHGNLLHLFSNILGLYVLTIGWQEKGPPIHGSLDNMSHQHLLAFLMVCGGMSSLVCNVRYAVLKSPAISLGFSAALYALMMYELSSKPESRIGLVFLPNQSYSAQNVSSFIIISEIFLLAISRYHRIDNFGHLVGLGFGYLYSKVGNDFWEYEKKEAYEILCHK